MKFNSIQFLVNDPLAALEWIRLQNTSKVGTFLTIYNTFMVVLPNHNPTIYRKFSKELQMALRYGKLCYTIIKAVQHCSDYWWYITELLIPIPDLSTVASPLTQLLHWSMQFKENSQSERAKIPLMSHVHSHLKYINSNVAGKICRHFLAFELKSFWKNKRNDWFVCIN